MYTTGEQNVTDVFIKDISQDLMLFIGMDKEPVTIILKIIRTLYKC